MIHARPAVRAAISDYGKSLTNGRHGGRTLPFTVTDNNQNAFAHAVGHGSRIVASYTIDKRGTPNAPDSRARDVIAVTLSVDREAYRWVEWHLTMRGGKPVPTSKQTKHPVR